METLFLLTQIYYIVRDKANFRDVEVRKFPFKAMDTLNATAPLENG